MSGLRKLGGLGGESGLVGFTVKNLDGSWLGVVGGFLCGRGQMTLRELIRSLASQGRASEVTEDQGLRDGDGQKMGEKEPGRRSAVLS